MASDTAAALSPLDCSVEYPIFCRDPLIELLHLSMRMPSWRVFTAIPLGTQHTPQTRHRRQSFSSPRTQNWRIVLSISANVSSLFPRRFRQMWEESAARSVSYRCWSWSSSIEKNFGLYLPLRSMSETLRGGEAEVVEIGIRK